MMVRLVVWPRAMNGRTLADRIAGCLLGGAVGDALGAPVEFLTLRQIREAFGPAGIRDYAPAYGRLGAITDDTQMMLFTTEGLLRAHVQRAHRPANTREVVLQAYLRWLRTQGEATDRVLGREPDHDGWLLTHRELWSRRAPGATCLAALREPAIDFAAKNQSKGCGGIMRIAPVGLFSGLGRTRGGSPAYELGVELASLTHGHPSASIASGYFAQLIALLADGHALRVAIELARSPLRLSKRADEVVGAIDRAVVLATEGGEPTPERIETLGEGWVADEALSIALYCALVAEDFHHGVLLAVNHGGDSDSTGLLTGNLLGVIAGTSAIPAGWLEGLELVDVIREMANDLALVREGGFDVDASSAKYPGW
jgi:ADP-ribosyl-[dinitrogen reductase] hydrolase